MEILVDMIQDFNPEEPHFHAAEIFNESWLVKAVLQQASALPTSDLPLSFLPHATWFSEAYLPTAFSPRYRGDNLAEARTHADGVIGHFTVGDSAKADFHLKAGARQFVVVEAKMGSPLSPGTSNAPGYDQAARNVACMAEALHLADLPAGTMERLAFVVLAPASHIEVGTFSAEMTVGSIRGKVQARVDSYEGALDGWQRGWFEPLIAAVELHTLSWKQAIAWIGTCNKVAAHSLQAFYEKCLAFN
jgi:hypothetical protein